MVFLNPGDERKRAVERFEQKKANAERLTRPRVEVLKAIGCPDRVELEAGLAPSMLNLLARSGIEPGQTS